MENFAIFGLLGILMVVSFIIYAIAMLVATKRHTTHLAAMMALALFAAPILSLLNVLPSFAYDEEACMEYDEWVVCFGLDISGDDYEFDIIVGDYQGSGSPALRCEIRHSSSSSALWEECDDEIRWTGNDGQFIISATLDGEDGTAIYDIGDEEWDLEFDEVDPDDVDDFSGNWSSSNGTSNSDEVDDIDVRTNSSTYEEDEWIDVTVELLDNDGDVATRAEGQVNFIVEERDGSSWDEASSSDYDLDMDDYDFDSGDDGEKRFNNLLRIDTEGEYRIRVEWDDDNDIYGTDSFDIDNDGGSSNSDEVDEIKVSSPSSQHEADEWIDVTIKLLDNDGDVATRAEGQVNFSVEKHQSNGWFTASSSDYSLDMTNYDFDSGDDGEVKLQELVKIRTTGEYRIRVEWDDDEDIYDTEIFDIWGTAGDDDDAESFDIDVDNDSPDEDESIDLIIQAERAGGSRADNYTNTVEFDVYYRDNNTWRKTTSSSYFSMDDDEYRFDAWDDGKVTLNNFVEFHREERFRIRVYDQDDSQIDGIVYIEVGDADGNNDGEPDYIDVDVSDDTPEEDEWIDVTLTVKDDNDDTVEDFNDDVEARVYIKDGNGWRRTTSSTYFSIDDDTIDFLNSYDGEAELDNYIKFRRDGEYRIEFEWTDNIGVNGSVEIEVGGSSNSDDLDRIDVDIEDTTPDEDRWLDLDLTMIGEDGDVYEDFDDEIVFKVYWYDDGVWRRTTNTSLFEINDDYENGYDFPSSKDGETELSDFIRFKQSYKFKIEVEVKDQTTVDGDVTVVVGDADDSINYTSADPDLLSVAVLTQDPNKNDRIDFRIKAITEDGDISYNYRNRVVFETQEITTLTSRNWRTPANGDYTTYISSYEFTTNDEGQKNLYDVWTARQDGYYRVTVHQDDDDDIAGWAYVFITDNVQYATTMPGFSSTERVKMRSFYKAWPQVINAIMDRYPELQGDSDWEGLWLDFYDRMEDTVRGQFGKFTSYSNFMSSLTTFVNRTVSDHINN